MIWRDGGGDGGRQRMRRGRNCDDESWKSVKLLLFLWITFIFALNFFFQLFSFCVCFAAQQRAQCVISVLGRSTTRNFRERILLIQTAFYFLSIFHVEEKWDINLKSTVVGNGGVRESARNPPSYRMWSWALLYFVVKVWNTFNSHLLNIHHATIMPHTAALWGENLFNPNSHLSCTK